MNPSIENFLRMQRILWLALMSSLVLMGLVAYLGLPLTGEPAPHFFFAIFIGVAIADLAVVQILRAKLLPPDAPPTSLNETPPDATTPEARVALGKLAQAHLISWALCEAVGLMGLVATTMLKQPIYYVGFASVALLFFVLYRPDPDDVTGALRAAAKR